MAVQKSKKSQSKTSSRFAQWKNSLKTPNLVECPQCHEYKTSHRVCANCGYYDGTQVVDTTKNEKKD